MRPLNGVVETKTGSSGEGHNWRKLVKNIGWANQNIGGQKVVKSDKCMADSQLLGSTCPGCPTLSLRLWSIGAIDAHCV